MILNELFGNPHEVTPESQRKIFFVVTKKSALRSILDQFGDQISECGGSLVAPGHIWSLIKDLAYTSGGQAIAITPLRMSNYGGGVRGDKNNVIGRLRDLQREFPLAAERNRAEVDEEYTDASATTPDTDTMANNLNQAGANYAVHAQMDQDVQNRYAAQKPIGTVKLSGST